MDSIKAIGRRQLAWVLVTGALPLAGCCSMSSHSSNPDPAGLKPIWHSVVMIPRTNLPAIHFYNKVNPVWWFGNIDEPRAPAWYRPDSRWRNFAWYFRNPLENFSNYVIGVADKKSVRSGKYPTQNSDPHGGWNFAVTRRRIVYLPFIDYKRGRFEFYFGWRERGNFGIKLNFRQALPKPPPSEKPPAVAPALWQSTGTTFVCFDGFGPGGPSLPGFFTSPRDSASR